MAEENTGFGLVDGFLNMLAKIAQWAVMAVLGFFAFRWVAAWFGFGDVEKKAEASLSPRENLAPKHKSTNALPQHASQKGPHPFVMRSDAYDKWMDAPAAEAPLAYSNPVEPTYNTKTVVTSAMGEARGSRTHRGIDIAVEGNKSFPKIFPAEAGVVLVAQSIGDYGTTVVIGHTDNNGKKYYTLYAHMQAGKNIPKVGESVTKGDAIGVMGKEGNSRGNGPHLHYELRDAKGNALDPIINGKSDLKKFAVLDTGSLQSFPVAVVHIAPTPSRTPVGTSSATSEAVRSAG